MPNRLEFQGGWNQIKGKLKAKYGELTDNDLMYVEGKEEELLGRLQQKTGQARQDLEREIDSLLYSGKH